MLENDGVSGHRQPCQPFFRLPKYQVVTFFRQDDEHSELQVEVILEPQGAKDELPSSKLTKYWNITIFNREYMFNRSIFHCYVSLPEGR